MVAQYPVLEGAVLTEQEAREQCEETYYITIQVSYMSAVEHKQRQRVLYLT